MKLNEAIEYLEEAASKPFLNAFNKDIATFPITMEVDSVVSSDQGLARIRIWTDSKNFLNSVAVLAAKRMGAAAKKAKIEGGKTDTQFGVVRFRADTNRNPSAASSNKLVNLLGQKLGIRPKGNDTLGSGGFKFIKTYDNLESLSNDIDKIAK